MLRLRHGHWYTLTWNGHLPFTGRGDCGGIMSWDRHSSPSSKVIDFSSQIFNTCIDTPNLRLTILHIPCKPIIQISHITHEFTLLVNGCHLRQSVFPKYLHHRIKLWWHWNLDRSWGHWNINPLCRSGSRSRVGLSCR